MKIRILQAQASSGARLLVQALREEGLNALRTKVHGSAYRGIGGHLIINWGRNEYPSRWSGAEVLNDPCCVANATDKVKCFETLEIGGMSHNLPIWSKRMSEAVDWFDVGVEKVYCRTLTKGSQGRGIIVANSPDCIIPAPLYTAGVTVGREVRVHVFQGEVIDYAQKKKLSSESRDARGFQDEPNEDVRNHGNGWVFARGGVVIEESIKRAAVKAILCLGLDFGAVDIVITPQGVGKILEVNTAPGLEGTTLESYKQAILRLI